jgi:hypothetical protein
VQARGGPSEMEFFGDGQEITKLAKFKIH